MACSPRPSFENAGSRAGLARLSGRHFGSQMAITPFFTLNAVGLRAGLARFSLVRVVPGPSHNPKNELEMTWLAQGASMAMPTTAPWVVGNSRQSQKTATPKRHTSKIKRKLFPG